jgi:hypothetical protein
MTIQELIIIERLNRIIAREWAKELRRGRICPECGERIHYSAADTVYLHEGGRYGCQG